MQKAALLLTGNLHAFGSHTRHTQVSLFLLAWLIFFTAAGMMPCFRSRRKTVTPMFQLLLNSAYRDPRTFYLLCHLATNEAWGSQGARRGRCHTADLNWPKGYFIPHGIILIKTGQSWPGRGSAVQWANCTPCFVYFCLFPIKLPLSWPPNSSPILSPAMRSLIPPKRRLSKQLCCACQVKP